MGFVWHCSSESPQPVLSSAKSVMRAQAPHALRYTASDALRVFRIVLPLQKLSLLTGPTESSRGALSHPGFGFRQVCRGLVCIGIPRA
nr:putative integron gene cassette protein [uncultured bacterium]